MSAFNLPLRRLTTRQRDDQQTHHACARAQWPVSLLPLPDNTLLLRFELMSDAGAIRCLISVAAWAQAHVPALSGLAWDALLPAHAQQLFSSTATPITLPAVCQVRGAARYLGTLCVAAGEPERQLPCLSSEEGPVWVEQFDCDGVPAMLHRLAGLRLRVSHCIARQSIALARLQALQPGDVLLIDRLEPYTTLGKRRLHAFTFTLDALTVTDIFDSFSDDGELPLQLDHEDGHVPPTTCALSALNVAVDVVLCRIDRTLEELANAHPGTTLALPMDVHRRVALMVNGQQVACGELVQVGDGLGIQINTQSSRT